MEKTSAFQYNVEAYISTIFQNNKKKIEGLDKFIIEIKNKDESKHSITIEKDEIVEKLGELLFNENVGFISEINICYEKDGIINILNGINVF